MKNSAEEALAATAEVQAFDINAYIAMLQSKYGVKKRDPSQFREAVQISIKSFSRNGMLQIQFN